MRANRTPNWKICRLGWPRDGSTTGAGRQEQNKAVFGFSRLTRDALSENAQKPAFAAGRLEKLRMVAKESANAEIDQISST